MHCGFLTVFKWVVWWLGDTRSRKQLLHCIARGTVWSVVNQICGIWRKVMKVVRWDELICLHSTLIYQWNFSPTLGKKQKPPFVELYGWIPFASQLWHKYSGKPDRKILTNLWRHKYRVSGFSLEHFGNDFKIYPGTAQFSLPANRSPKNWTNNNLL